MMDVTDLVAGFEAHNHVRISFRFGMAHVSKGPSLSVTAEAWEMDEDAPGAQPLASVSVICSAMNLKSWNAVLTHVMYALDFQLALNDLETKAPQKA